MPKMFIPEFKATDCRVEIFRTTLQANVYSSHYNAELGLLKKNETNVNRFIHEIVYVF